MTARLCPACVHRRARLVDPACPVCQGAGVLQLGHAEHITTAPETAHAVAITLEAVARRVEHDYPHPGPDRDAAAHDVLAAAVAELRRVGVLASSTPPAAPAAGTAMDMAQAATLVPVRPIDWQLADAAAYAYAPTDRPLARGMPVLSADGHPSHLARLCDPADPETPTSADVDARDRARRGGRVLAEAARVNAAERTDLHGPLGPTKP